MLLRVGILGYKSLAFAVHTSGLTHLSLRGLKPERGRFLPTVTDPVSDRREASAVSTWAGSSRVPHSSSRVLGSRHYEVTLGSEEVFLSPSWHHMDTHLHDAAVGGLNSSLRFQRAATPRFYTRAFFPRKCWIGLFMGLLNVGRFRFCETRTSYPSPCGLRAQGSRLSILPGLAQLMTSQSNVPTWKGWLHF